MSVRRHGRTNGGRVPQEPTPPTGDMDPDEIDRLFTEGARRAAVERAAIDAWRGTLPRFGWHAAPTLHARSVDDLVNEPLARREQWKDLARSRVARGDDPAALE